jgi:DNA replication protein DnaC
VVAELSTLRFVEERRNVILLGPPGVGKMVCGLRGAA